MRRWPLGCHAQRIERRSASLGVSARLIFEPIPANSLESPTKKIALEEHFTTSELLPYAHGPRSSMDR